MNNAERLFDDGKMQFICGTGDHPTRVLMSWKLWRELVEPHIRYLHPSNATSEYLKDEPTFEGIRVIRTYDFDGMEFLA